MYVYAMSVGLTIIVDQSPFVLIHLRYLLMLLLLPTSQLKLALVRERDNWAKLAVSIEQHGRAKTLTYSYILICTHTAW